MRMLAKILITMACGLAGSAVAAERQPEWVTGTPRFYASELYIVGVGSGDDRSDAETRARAGVSAVFSVRVTGQTQVSASQKEVVEGNRTKFSSTQTVIQEATAVTGRVLEGVAIAETWEDPASHRIYALAVLNRKKAATVVRQKLQDLETAAKPQIAQLAAESDSMRRAGAGFRVQSLAAHREALVGDLRVIQPGADDASDVDWEASRRSADAAVRALQVSVRVDGSESARAVQTGAVKAMSGLGIRVAEAGTNPNIAVVVTLEAATTGPQDGWYYTRLTATAYATDVKLGTQVTQFDASMRKAATDPSEASHRASDAVAKLVAEGLQPALRAYFEGQ